MADDCWEHDAEEDKPLLGMQPLTPPLSPLWAREKACRLQVVIFIHDVVARACLLGIEVVVAED